MGADIPIPHQPGPALPRSVNVVAMSKSRDYAYTHFYDSEEPTSLSSMENTSTPLFSSPDPLSVPLSRFACDFCREKKIRCSREQPKCATCRPWPGECVYSKEVSAPRYQTGASSANTGILYPTKKDLDSFQERLSRIEAALEKLARAVDSLNPNMNRVDATFASEKSSRFETIQYQSVDKEETNTQTPPNQNQLFVPPANISIDAETLNSNASLLSYQQPGFGSLQCHPSPFIRASLDASCGISLLGNEAVAGFFIPSRALGYTLIGRFLNISDLADLIAIKPSDQILMEVIFEPASVTQRSWVLYINFIFLIISHKDQTLSHLTTSFRHNIRLALDDAKIFLEPNEVNVQALTMLSCLGEDYTSPSLSWMLASHACRQAQALSLHFTEQHYSTEQQRRLTLFWVVFMVDKACALVFGHPILLSSKLYENVPLPDFQHLLKFRPRYGQSNNVHSQLYLSTFGAHFLTQNIKLARLTGLILDIPTNGSQHSGREGLISYLDDWDVSTRQILSEARGLEADHASEEQLRGMSLAIRLMRFKYLHILVLTLPEDVQYATLRLESSREALSLLSHLSSKHHVYRGIFWTLLYYPFTSFFVVFNHITCNPEAPTTSGDLDLLTTTLSYFQSMKVKLHTQSVVTSELEKMVESFIQLARSAVSKDIPSYT